MIIVTVSVEAQRPRPAVESEGDLPDRRVVDLQRRPVVSRLAIVRRAQKKSAAANRAVDRRMPRGDVAIDYAALIRRDDDEAAGRKKIRRQTAAPFARFERQKHGRVGGALRSAFDVDFQIARAPNEL